MPPPPSTDLTLRAENAELRVRLEEAEETLRAIRAGKVDAIVVEGDDGPQLFTLQGVDAEQNRLRGAMLAQVSDALITVDNEERITFLNGAAELLYDVRAGEVLGRGLDEILTRRWLSPEAEAGMRTALRERGQWHGELIHRTRGGRDLHIESSAAALRGPDGECVGVVRTIRDVTGRKRLEREKADALRLLDTLLTRAPVGFVFLDRDLRFVRINERLAEINGLTIAEHLGKTVTEILPTLEANLREVTTRILATGQPVLDHEFSGETARAPGITRYWNQSWYPVHDERGEIMGFGAVVDEITERRKNERALRLLNERFALAVKCSRAVLWQQDLELRFTWLHNPAPGIDGSDVVGKREADFLERTEDAAGIEGLKREVIRSGVGVRREFFPQIQGVGRRFELMMEPLRDAAGVITGLTGAAIDITELKRAEDRLRLHRQLLETIVNHLPAAVALIRGRDLTFQMVNPGYQAISPGKQMVGKTIAEVWPETHPLFGQRCHHVLETGELFDAVDERFEICRDSDGPLEKAYFSWSMRRVNLPDEVEPGLLVTVWETTARKAIELALAKSEQHLSYALQAAGAGAWDWDIRSDKIVWSMENYRLYELDPAQGPPRYADWESRVHLEDRARANENVRAVLEGRTSEFRTEFRVVSRQGAVRWLLGLGRGERDREGQPLRLSGINLDITELKQAEAQVRQLNQELEEKVAELALASKYKSEFLANMSHELRTPLNSILIFSDVLAENAAGNLTPKQVESSRHIHSSGNDLLALINEILDLAKIESGFIHVCVDRISTASLRDTLERSFRHQAEAKGLRFQVAIAADLPDAMDSDPQRLQQILRNLISNAVKFTDHGCVDVRVGLATRGWSPNHPVLSQVPEVVAFVVEDTGPGIAPEKQRLIFEAFQQCDASTSRKYGGTGLGLAISRELAAVLGGEIKLISAEGRGSTFTLYLPLHCPDPARPPPVPAPVPPGPRNRNGSNRPAAPDEALRHRTVLVVDDDPRNIYALVSLLENHEMHVLTATNGRSGIEIIKHTPDLHLVLMDVMMPELDGYDTIRQIRQSPEFRNLPIIALTAKAMKGDREKCLEAGASDYIAKPVETVQLLSLMRGWLSR